MVDSTMCMHTYPYLACCVHTALPEGVRAYVSCVYVYVYVCVCCVCVYVHWGTRAEILLYTILYVTLAACMRVCVRDCRERVGEKRYARKAK